MKKRVARIAVVSGLGVGLVCCGTGTANAAIPPTLETWLAPMSPSEPEPSPGGSFGSSDESSILPTDSGSSSTADSPSSSGSASDSGDGDIASSPSESGEVPCPRPAHPRDRRRAPTPEPRASQPQALDPATDDRLQPRAPAGRVLRRQARRSAHRQQPSTAATMHRHPAVDRADDRPIRVCPPVGTSGRLPAAARAIVHRGTDSHRPVVVAGA